MSDVNQPNPRRPGFRAGLSRFAGAVVWPLLFSVTASFFVWSMVYGDRGLVAKQAREAQIEAAKADLHRAREEEAAMERRVQALRGDRLDLDVLDERARHLFNLMGRDETVVLYEPGRRLF
jgi:cell division protein FtsB